MFDKVLRIKFIALKNSFIYLSQTHISLNTGACFKLVNFEKTLYFSAIVVNNLVDDNSVGINSSYAKILGLEENDYITLSEIEQLPLINSITVQPQSKADYEVLDLLAQDVQLTLLNQVKVVSVGQKLIIWIGSNLSVSVMVNSVEPISPGVLDFLAEVVIIPIEEIKLPELKGEPTRKRSNQYTNLFEKSFKSRLSDKWKESVMLCYTFIPASFFPFSSSSIKNDEFPFRVLICPNEDLEDRGFYAITLLNSSNAVEPKSLNIQVIFLEESFPNNISTKIFLNDDISAYLQCKFGAKLILENIRKPAPTKEIEIRCKKCYVINVVTRFKELLAKVPDKPFLLNSNFPITLSVQLNCTVSFLPNNAKFCIITEDFLRECSYSIVEEHVAPLEKLLNKITLPKDFCINVQSANKICDNLFSILFRSNYYNPENIIIVGRKGIGKSAILKYLSKKFRMFPYFIKTRLVSCKTLKGKTVNSLQKVFNDILNNLVEYQPALLILDDFAVLCSSTVEGDENPNSIYFNRLSEMLFNLLSDIQQVNKIGILCSIDNVLNLNSLIYQSRGNHLFKNILNINDLTKSDRITLLEFYLRKYKVENINYEELSLKTDGFVIQDLKDLCKKTHFLSCKNSAPGIERIIRQDHCLKALEKMCSLSLLDINFNSPGNKYFSDIGGLKKVKNVLVENLLWPLKYPLIFGKSPLKLQSGILLYGFPGTGKTLLAGAAANQCNLRLISVKGPELLSKYIGASEQAVRDIFEKAQRARPCILFFDEFDSLAPRRGHDNTGVTDRVVNQLLTQLDGIEALEGVCIIAATSRPDLLDPALLRPGRLDKQLLCPLPNRKEREEILRIIGLKLQFHLHLNWEDVAQRTEGYSGADLHAVLYTAQINALNQFVHNAKVQKIPDKISAKNLQDAVAATKPSLSKRELAKYKIIYEKFSAGKENGFQPGSKVTLA